MIIWLTGNSGAGKSTLATALAKPLGAIILDGDDMRYAISEKAGFSREDRHEHNLRVARLARILSLQGFKVIVAVIAPFRHSRRAIEQIIPDVRWVYLKRKLPKDPDRPYEPPESPWLVIDTDRASVRSCTITILNKAGKLGLAEVPS